MKRGTSRSGQLSLPLKSWGGFRRGAGRKPTSGRPGTRHRARPEHNAAHPLHVTLRAGIRPLRSQQVFPTVRRALSQATWRADSFRVVHFSVQADHLHLIVEASNKADLSRGMRGLVIRIARQVNRLLMRKGPLWADRWHGRPLTSPRQVRNALVYVFGNFRKHMHRAPALGIDPFSSARYFDGWRLAAGHVPSLAEPAPLALFSADPNESGVVAPGTWLARKGWKRRGLIDVEECPR
jgi:REP element-mobilizing transposase RayT